MNDDWDLPFSGPEGGPRRAHEEMLRDLDRFEKTFPVFTPILLSERSRFDLDTAKLGIEIPQRFRVTIKTAKQSTFSLFGGKVGLEPFPAWVGIDLFNACRPFIDKKIGDRLGGRVGDEQGEFGPFSDLSLPQHLSFRAFSYHVMTSETKALTFSLKSRGASIITI
jgi:hypothetical protein